MKTTYTDEELRGIISTALKRQHAEDSSYDRDQLEKTARQFGISGKNLDLAISEYFKSEKERRKHWKKQQQKRQGVLIHAFFFVVVNVGLLIANTFFGEDFPLHIILPGWGLGLIIHIMQDWFGINFDKCE